MPNDASISQSRRDIYFLFCDDYLAAPLPPPLSYLPGTHPFLVVHNCLFNIILIVRTEFLIKKNFNTFEVLR
jgi:hypothetical protein